MVATALAAAAMIWALGAPLPHFWLPLTVCALLWAVSWRWQPNLLRGLATLVAFSVAFTLLMEAAAAARLPLADRALASIDAALGLNAPALVAWVAKFPKLSLLMKCAYFSVMPQTCLVILLNAEKPELWIFLRRFFLAAQISVCLFFLFPAEGVATCLSPPVMARFHALRGGAPLDWQQAQGIITFPSFHAAWGIILVAAFWKSPLRWPAVALNTLMIASTVTTGGHYFIDVPGGILVGLVAIMHPASSLASFDWAANLWRQWARRQPNARSGGAS
jgi:membrane-associated phospholipid phosphatase